MSLAAARSTAVAWDEFLLESPRGQFQQTSGWAQVKSREGWSAVREYLDPAEPRSGGFQLLWKHAKFTRIGYVSKGPVLPAETAAAVDAALERVVSASRRLGLGAVVVQPPDDSLISSQMLVRHGCFVQPVESVIRATAIVSLEGGADDVVARMSRSTREQWRRARRERVTLAWGARGDLPEFFRLMCESAEHQGSPPNPGRVDLLEALWDALPDRVSLAFAEHSGRKLAGWLMIGHGRRISFWKKGWDSAEPRLFTSQFLTAECLAQASAAGYAAADMVAMSPDLAARLLAGEGRAEEHSRGRDVFNLRLGARPKLLPPAHLLVLNPALRGMAYAALRWQRLRSVLESRVG